MRKETPKTDKNPTRLRKERRWLARDMANFDVTPYSERRLRKMSRALEQLRKEAKDQQL